MKINSRCFKIILAFLMAPLPLFMVSSIIIFTSALIFKEFLGIFDLLTFAFVLIFSISYANLLILGIPCYYICKKYNLLHTSIPLYFSFFVGFLEGFGSSYIGNPHVADPHIAEIFNGIAYGLSGLIVSYFLLKKLRKYHDKRADI